MIYPQAQTTRKKIKLAGMVSGVLAIMLGFALSNHVSDDEMIVTGENLHSAVDTSTVDLNDYFEIVVRGEADAEREITNLEKIVAQLPEEHVHAIKRLFLIYDDPKAIRGLGGNKSIFIRAVNVTEEEFISLFVHELGHIVDLGLITGNSNDQTDFYDATNPVYSDDMSLDFYRICWKDSYNRNENCSDNDFVSGYARTDVFEDFAESYLYYVLHGKEFREIARGNEALSSKYNYLKKIFNEKEFDTGTLSNIKWLRPWDATQLDWGDTLIELSE